MTLRATIFLSLTLSAFAFDAAAQTDAPPTDAAPKPARAWTDFPRPKFVPIQASSIRGVGPRPLVIIADMGVEPSAYDGFADRFAPHFTIHTLCMPGTTVGTRGPQLGRGHVKDPEWLLNAVDAVAAYIQEKKLDKPVVIGHSLGGMAAYMLAITKPEAASSYVIVNMLPARSVGGPGRIPIPEMRGMEVDTIERERLLGQTRSSWLNRVRDTVPGQCRDLKFSENLINMYSRIPLSAAKRYELESFYLDLREDLDNVRTPMLVVLTIPEWFERLEREVLKSSFINVGHKRPNVSVEVLDNTRDWGIVEDPDRFDPPLRKFLGLPLSDKAPESKPEAPAEKPAEKKATP